MIKSMGLLVAGVLCLGACNVEHYDDCDAGGFDYDDEFENGSHRAGTSAKAGSGGSQGGSSSSGGSSGSTSEGGSSEGGSTNAGTSGSSVAGAGEGGSPEPLEPPATPCDRERDCEPGFNCNLDTNECVAASEETCAELETESACAERGDCVPIYGGTNCSCGQDCECQGGEPGCICESFQFFVCQASD